MLYFLFIYIYLYNFSQIQIFISKDNQIEFFPSELFLKTIENEKMDLLSFGNFIRKLLQKYHFFYKLKKYSLTRKIYLSSFIRFYLFSL